MCFKWLPRADLSAITLDQSLPPVDLEQAAYQLMGGWQDWMMPQAELDFSWLDETFAAS